MMPASHGAQSLLAESNNLAPRAGTPTSIAARLRMIQGATETSFAVL
jgi:hypothetical protein